MSKAVISKSQLRNLIRLRVHARICEQVVGYNAPTDTSGEDDGDGKGSGDDYLGMGSTGMGAAQDSQKEKAAADTNTRELTQQRQGYLNKDDAVTADDTGRQLQDLIDQKNEGIMRLTKRQLRRAIKEACGLAADEPVSLPPELPPEVIAPPPEEAAVEAVPVPEDYNAVRDFLEGNPELVDMSIAAVMDASGAGCERSSAQGIIDHLQDMVQPAAAPEAVPMDLIGMLGESGAKYSSNRAFHGWTDRPDLKDAAPEAGYKGVPYLEGSYSGNGMVPGSDWQALVPVMEEIGDPMFQPALDIIAGRAPAGIDFAMSYIPFIYGDSVLIKLQELLDSGEAPPTLTQELITTAGDALGDEDREYADYRDDIW